MATYTVVVTKSSGMRRVYNGMFETRVALFCDSASSVSLKYLIRRSNVHSTVNVNNTLSLRDESFADLLDASL